MKNPEQPLPEPASQPGPSGSAQETAAAADAVRAAAQGQPDLAELRARVAALEGEQARLLTAYAAAMESEIARLRSTNLQAVSGQPAEPRREPLTPPYLTGALVAIEDHLADMERFAATGDEAAARQAKVAAALRTCSVLKRLCDDDGFHQTLITMQEQGTQQTEASIQNYISGTAGQAPFRDAEVQLLQLAGLPELLAQTHVDEAIAAYRVNPAGAVTRMRNPMMFLDDLRQLRDASCESADLLAQGIRRQQSRQRWKKLLTFGLGGTIIVVANGAGTALLGPIGVAASGAIGSAAVGVAAQLLQ